MKFVERKAKDQFKKGDVIRFKNKRDNEYCYALIAELPCSEHRNAAIILGNNGPVHAGDTYRSGKSIDDLREDLRFYDIVQVVRTETRVLTD